MSCWKTRISLIRPSVEGEQLDDVDRGRSAGGLRRPGLGGHLHDRRAAGEDARIGDRALPVLCERGAHVRHAVEAVVRPAVGQRCRLLDAQVGVEQRTGPVEVAGAEPAGQLPDDRGGVDRRVGRVHRSAPLAGRLDGGEEAVHRSLARLRRARSSRSNFGV